MEISMGFSAVLYSFVIAVATGFLFSLYPSLKAANMNPVEALRAE
jgi:ABC-type antimicrobial peptide transport system permease subunit